MGYIDEKSFRLIAFILDYNNDLGGNLMKTNNIIFAISCVALLTSCGSGGSISSSGSTHTNTSGSEPVTSSSNASLSQSTSSSDSQEKSSTFSEDKSDATKRNAIKSIIAAIKGTDGYDESWDSLRLREDDSYRSYSTLDLTVDEDSNTFGFNAINHYKRMPEGVEFGRVVVTFSVDSLPDGIGWFGDESLQNPAFIVEYNLPADYTSSTREYDVLFEKNYDETKLTDTNAAIEYHSLTGWGMNNLKGFLEEHSLDLSAFLPNF